MPSTERSAQIEVAIKRRNGSHFQTTALMPWPAWHALPAHMQNRLEFKYIAGAAVSRYLKTHAGDEFVDINEFALGQQKLVAEVIRDALMGEIVEIREHWPLPPTSDRHRAAFMRKLHERVEENRRKAADKEAKRARRAAPQAPALPAQATLNSPSFAMPAGLTAEEKRAFILGVAAQTQAPATPLAEGFSTLQEPGSIEAYRDMLTHHRADRARLLDENDRLKQRLAQEQQDHASTRAALIEARQTLERMTDGLKARIDAE